MYLRYIHKSQQKPKRKGNVYILHNKNVACVLLVKEDTMKSVLKELFFDKYLVKRMRQNNINPGILYQQLISGRITLQEYLAAGH